MLRPLVPLWLALSTAALAQDPPLAPARAPTVQVEQAGVIELDLQGLEGLQRIAALAALDIARYTTRGTIGSARLQRLLDEAPGEIRAALEPFGHYDATATVTVTPLPERRHLVRIVVTPGEPVRITEVTVVVEGPAGREQPIMRRLEAFEPGVGAVLDHRAYEAGKAAIERALQRLGYFDSELLEHRVEVRRADRTATIVLRWESGDRFRFGETSFEGAQFPAAFMHRFVAWERDALYDQAGIEQMQQRLAAAGFFRGIEIEPRVEDRADGAVPVRVGLQPAARTAWTIGVYYESNYGAGTRAGVDWRWLNDAGHSMRVDVEAAQSLQAGAIEYRIPHHNLHGVQWLAGFGARNEDTDSINGRSLLLRAGLLGTWQDWTGIASLNALRGSFRVGSRRIEPDRRLATVVYPELSVGRVFARDRIRPRRGSGIKVILRAADDTLGSDVDLAQIRVEGRHIMPLGDAARLLGRIELGYTSTNNFDDLPPELRFFAGGDNSVRGYAWQDLGPRDADDLATGATQVATWTLEYERNFRPDWSWAAFVDGGNAFDGSDFEPAWGAGGGVRWSSPIGPIRLDLARGFDERGGWQLHFSAGPDL
jgi:translocation and assembly module TamA